jgi:hypothetical protein
MASPNPLNVYKGQESIQKYFDPESAPPLPLVEIPDSLNPYRQDGVRIYAKMMTMHPANNVKAMPGTAPCFGLYMLSSLDDSLEPSSKLCRTWQDKGCCRVQLWINCPVHVIDFTSDSWSR